MCLEDRGLLFKLLEDDKVTGSHLENCDEKVLLGISRNAPPPPANPLHPQFPAFAETGGLSLAGERSTTWQNLPRLRTLLSGANVFSSG